MFFKYCNDLQPAIQKAYQEASFSIVMHKNIIEIYGLDQDAQKAYEIICEAVKNNIRDTKVQVELALEHKDFINGKKNGKINRIVKLSSCRISFQENPADCNMMIDLYSPSPQSLLHGISMLQEELPAEMSFYVPEVYHKRIIGVAGKNIQKIMKRYGVYVKFSNMAEFESLGGYYENKDNVICRTPAKNHSNLKDLKQTIVEVVNAPDLIESEDTILVPRQLFHWCLGDDTNTVHDALETHGVTVEFSPCEQGSDTVTISGPEHLVPTVKETIRVLIS
jgi:hypothetical protein